MRNIVLFALFVLLLIGCGNNDESGKRAADKNKAEISEAERNALYEMKYKFTEGEKLNYQLTTITNTTQSVSSDTLIEMDVTQTINYKFLIDVLKVDEKDISTIAVNINYIDLTAYHDGETAKYNSEMELSDEKRMEYFEYETLKKITYHATLNTRGEILSITNLDAMIDRMVSLQGYTQKLTDQEKVGVKENLSAMLIKPLTQHLFRVLPDHQIGIDSVWEHRYPSSLATFEIENIASFRVLRINQSGEDKIAEFNASLSINATGENSYSEKGVSYYFDTPIVSGTGAIEFNINKGALVKSKTTTRVETQGIVEAIDENGVTQRAERRDITVSTNIIEKK